MLFTSLWDSIKAFVEVWLSNKNDFMRSKNVISNAMLGFDGLQGQNPSLIKSIAGVKQLQTRKQLFCMHPKINI